MSPLAAGGPTAAAARAVSATSRDVRPFFAGAVGSALANTGSEAVGLLLAGLLLAIVGLVLVRRARRAS